MDAATDFFAGKPKLRPKTVEGYKASLTNVYGKLGDFPIASLGNKEIKHYVKERQNEGHHVALRNDLAFLSSLYSFLIDREEDITINPVRSFSKKNLASATKHKRSLSQAEVRKILAACTQPYQRLFIMIAALTGMRSTEVRLLTWDEIDLDEGKIKLGQERTKNADGRIVPIHDDLLVELKAFHASRGKVSNFVFYNVKEEKPYTTFKTFWAGVKKRSGITNIRIHDLRHTYASWAKEKGIDELTIMSVMGHKSRSMVHRYAHISPDHVLKSSSEMMKAIRIGLSDSPSGEEKSGDQNP